MSKLKSLLIDCKKAFVESCNIIYGMGPHF